MLILNKVIFPLNGNNHFSTTNHKTRNCIIKNALSDHRTFCEIILQLKLFMQERDCECPGNTCLHYLDLCNNFFEEFVVYIWPLNHICSFVFTQNTLLKSSSIQYSHKLNCRLISSRMMKTTEIKTTNYHWTICQLI